MRRRLKTPSSPFGAKFNLIDIFDEERIFLGETITRSGITYDFSLERVLVAVWAHYRLEDFDQLPLEQQAYLIAAHRVQNQISAVLSKDREMKEKQAESLRKAQQAVQGRPF